MARRRRRDPWASQAAMQALVRFGPEISGLNELQREAESEYRTGLRQARGNAQGTIASIDAAIPGVRDIYEHAGLTQARTAHTFTGDAGKIDPSSPLAAAAALEQQTGIRHLNEAQAAALTGLQDQRVAARSGQTYAMGKARSDFINAIGRILTRKQDLARERGAFTSATAQQLMQTDLDRQQQRDIASARLTQSERNSLRSAGINPDTGKAIPGGPNDPNSPRYKGKGRNRGGSGGGATNVQIAAAQDAVQESLSWARRLSAQGLSRADVAHALSGGRKASEIPLHDPQTGKPVYWRAGEKGNEDGRRTGEPKTRSRAAIPAAKSQLLLSAALDVVYLGYVSPETRRKLHARGLWLTSLGLPRHPPRGGSTGVVLAPGANGQSRPG